MFYRFYIELNKPNSFAAREALVHDLDDPHAQWNLQDDVLPDFTPKFGDLWLTKNSSLVDFVDDGSATGGHGLLVSEKALAVLQKLKLPPNRAYAQETVQNDKKISARYYWVQMLSVQYPEWIDFSKSEFQLKCQFEMDTYVYGNVTKIANAKELRAIIEALGENDQDLLFSKLVLNEKYQESGYDIFWLDRLGAVGATYPIVSERLKEAFEKNKLVGYQLRELPILIEPSSLGTSSNFQ